MDPKAFFAPGKAGWTAHDLNNTYGNHDWLTVATFYGGAMLDQHDYAAIILVNPAEGAGPLELATTVAGDRADSSLARPPAPAPRGDVPGQAGHDESPS